MEKKISITEKGLILEGLSKIRLEQTLEKISPKANYHNDIIIDTINELYEFIQTYSNLSIKVGGK